MAFIVMALGVLMSIIGLGAIAMGYPIIEVERGWATVISGAVLLSGGLITVALGIVVRSLHGLRVGTPPAPVATQAPAETAAMTSFTTVSRGASSPPLEVGIPALAVAAPVAAVLASGALRRQDVPSPAFQPAYEPPNVAGTEWSAEPAHVDPSATQQIEDDIPALSEHDPAAVDPHVEAEPPLSDEAWLDQAFSAFDYEAAGAHPSAAEAASDARTDHEPVHQEADAHLEPQGHTEPAAYASPEAEAPLAAHLDVPSTAEDVPPRSQPGDAHSHEVAAAPEPALAAPATAPEAPATNLAVIGRYDSDGTSYVMFSDGSIEAQSEAGIYRFSSMAELKAFIEG